MGDQPPNYSIPPTPPQGDYPQPPQGGYPPPQYGYPPPQGGYQMPLQPGMPGPMYLEAPNSAMAVASMILGIVGIVALPLIGSILALIFGYMARNEIRTSQGRVGGQGMATAGIIMGYIGIGISILLTIFVIGTFVFVATQLPHYVITPTVGP